MTPSADIYRRLRSRILAGALSGGTAAASWWYYVQHVCKLPEMYYHKESKLAEVMQKHCQSLQKPYRPTPWFWSGNAHSLFGMLREFTIRNEYHRELLNCPDGGTAALDWWQNSHADESLAGDTPIVLVLHGLGGSSSEGYCKWMCSVVAAKGWRAVALNYRGCGGLDLTTPKTYSAAFIDDVKLAIDNVTQKFPNASLAAVGYSLGSKMLTRYCSVYDNLPEGSKLTCAIMISNPFCMTTVTRKFEVPFSIGWMYNLALTAWLKLYINQHKDELQKKISMEAVNECWTLRHFDEEVTMKLFDYDTADEYHKDGSSVHHIESIKTPSLFLIAKDDPFLGRLPIKECESNPNTLLAVTQRGGHVAFMEGLWPLGPAWMDKVAAEFLTPFLDPPKARL